MKILFLTLWCLVPLGLVAFHYGPGQTGVALDQTATHLADAQRYANEAAWPAAVDAYELSLASLPKERVAESREIRLELAKAKMQSSGLPEARTELEALSNELEADPKADPKVRDGTMAALASSRFYMTYLMKLEGLPDTEWEPEIEAARQERKLLVERAQAAGDTKAAAVHADDLESAIRLERADPAELYGLPIPKPCNCKSGKCNKPSPKMGKKKSEDSRGASAGPPIDGEGS
ncbi:hypothetical protein JIN85_06075 [Luteolibacter pohnpeiensis]|uniref:Uncharacterized protein n=1 Tax=Luteolibacter pohnpeiensis TaxID=454153 RepID=A0A934SAW9_9BACT|nr:hypothetical protein [Luteolibacter pohnpeiensis]MBK1881973.1 hypothetical protein [Luteolibacter pohnpeiensis]